MRAKKWTKRALALTHATRVEFRNAFVAPQLAKLASSPPEGDPWVHEGKLDGYRAAANVLEGRARLWSRNGIDCSARFPKIRDSIARLATVATLDGEIIAGSGKRVDFNLLQATLSGKQHGVLTIVLFDLLYIDGVSIAEAPLIERKELLRELLADPPPHVAYSAHIPGEGAAAFELASSLDFEGIVSKRGDRPYRSGRSDDWLKIKSLVSEDYAVVGYTPGVAARHGIGSLLLAKPGPRGWIYVGRVGTGFSDRLLAQLRHVFGSAGAGEPTVNLGSGGDYEQPALRNALWLPPLLVAEVWVRGTSERGLLRQPSLKAIRWDKRADELQQLRK